VKSIIKYKKLIIKLKLRVKDNKLARKTSNFCLTSFFDFVVLGCKGLYIGFITFVEVLTLWRFYNSFLPTARAIGSRSFISCSNLEGIKDC
jgi:hypothetical protein